MTRPVHDDWRITLVGAHPRLFHPVAGRPEAVCGYPECDSGWRDILEKACSRIEAAFADGDSFCVQQIKEKYGTLRFYWTGSISGVAKASIDNAIALAEARSACTCEVCGEEGRLYGRGDWLVTACVEHAKGEPVPIKPGYENLHTVWKFFAGELRIVSYRRYDRNSDSFIEVDPTSITAEE